MGNYIIIYLLSQFFAEKYNLVSEEFPHNQYNLKNDFNINYFCGEKFFKEEILINDDNVLDLLSCDIIEKKIILQGGFFQKKEIFSNSVFSEKVQKYIKPIKINDIKHDLFVHVRLGDVKNSKSLPYEYYKNQIKKINFNRGAISSDSLNDDLVKKLSKEFNLEFFENSPEYVIRYASQCKKIVLSSGSFSFLIGFFASNDSIKYYITNSVQEQKFNISPWCGDFFDSYVGKRGWEIYVD